MPDVPEASGSSSRVDPAAGIGSAWLATDAAYVYVAAEASGFKIERISK